MAARSWLPLLLLGGVALAAEPASVVELAAGTFSIGGGEQPDEQPVREVRLGAFAIDRREVRLGEYRASASGGVGLGPEHPVVGVSYAEAEAWCRARGGRLPTEEEWERACKAGSGGPYPWGKGQDRPAVWWDEALYGKHGLLPGLATLPRTDPSTWTPEGVEELAGSVWEWTSSRYHRESYARPEAAAQSPWRVIRGGSYANLPSYATCTHREPARPEEPRLTLGFRCVYPR